MESSDPELLYASKEPDIDYLQGAFSQTQDDLGEWLDRRQRDWVVPRGHYQNIEFSRGTAVNVALFPDDFAPSC